MVVTEGKYSLEDLGVEGNNIKLEVKDIECNSVHWINLA
jgi:hypothetical protein